MEEGQMGGWGGRGCSQETERKTKRDRRGQELAFRWENKTAVKRKEKVTSGEVKMCKQRMQPKQYY